MEKQIATETNLARESGAVLHRRETNWQIYLPFLFGIATLVGVFLIVALPSDPIWRIRAQAIGDFLYTLLCTIPILLCLLPIYVMVLLGIYGMRKLHSSVERPLRKLEHLTEGLAERIETATAYVNETSISWSSNLEPLENVFNIFDESAPTQKKEQASDE